MIRGLVGRLPVLLCLFALVAAGCGGDAEPSGNETPAGAGTTTTSSPGGAATSPADGGATEIEGEADLDALAEAAREEGSMTLYGVLDESVLQDLAAQFSQEYGVNVDVVRLVSADLQQRFAAEADAGAPAADAIILSHSPFFNEAFDSGWLTPLDDAGLPNFPGDFPEQYIVNDGGAAVVSVIPTTMVYNTEVVESPPTDWQDYADPAYAGGLLHIARPDSSPISLAFWQMLREEYGDEYLQDVAANEPVWHNSAVPATQAVAAGEGALGHPGVDAIVKNLQGEGAPIEQVMPELTSGPLTAIGLAEGAQNPNAAKLFAAWLLTEDGARFLADASSAGSPYGYNLPEDFRPPQVPNEEQAAELMELLGVE